MQGFKLRPASSYTSDSHRDLPKSAGEAAARFREWETRPRRRTSECKLAHNTVLERVPGGFGVRFHETVIVTFYEDGRVKLNTAGWQTFITRDRMNRCGVRIGMTGGVASVSHGGREVAYRDRMTLHPDGGATYEDGSRAKDAEPVRAERRRVLARYRRAEKRGKTDGLAFPFYWPLRSGGRAHGGNAPEAFAD